MRGYIRRLSRDIEKLEFKRNRLYEFFAKQSFTECDGTQVRLLKEQGELMDQLLVVMKERLAYEKKLHSDEDYPEELDLESRCCDEQEITEE